MYKLQLDNLEKYDTGYWSTYDLSKLFLVNPSSSFYHQLHLVQLDVLFTMTKEKSFQIYRDRWNSYSNNSKNYYNALLRKYYSKFFIIKYEKYKN